MIKEGPKKDARQKENNKIRRNKKVSLYVVKLLTKYRFALLLIFNRNEYIN